MTVSVIIADDEELNRAILEKELLLFDTVAVVARCKNGFETVAAVQEYKPDLGFLDIAMPRRSGFDVLELLGEQDPPVVYCLCQLPGKIRKQGILQGCFKKWYRNSGECVRLKIDTQVSAGASPAVNKVPQKCHKAVW